MVKTKREYVLATCFLSGIGAILSLVSIGTQDWVTAKAELLSSPSDELSVVNYGLFSGVFEQNFGGRTYYKLESKQGLDNPISIANLKGDSCCSDLPVLGKRLCTVVWHNH